MTIARGPRLEAARRTLARFAQEGKLPAGQPDAGGYRAADLQKSPARWPVSRQALAAQLARRLGGQDRPAQLGTSYCGPAAFLYCLLEDRPDIYVDYAVALWQHGHYQFGVKGKAMDLYASPGMRSSMVDLHRLARQHPKQRYVSDLDWMTMASLSASTRHGGWLFGAPGPDDQAGSVTYPGMMRHWFTSAGCAVRADTMGLGLNPSSPRQTIKLMSHWADSWLVLQIDASLIASGGIGFWTNRHWVVVSPHNQPIVQLGPKGQVMPLGSALARFDADTHQRMFAVGADIDKTPDPMEWETRLHIVSWGSEDMRARNAKLGYYRDRIYGGYAFSRMR